MYQDPLEASSSSGAAVASVISSSSHEPQRDGKGRIQYPSGKAELVHLDGGGVPEQLEVPASVAGPVVEGAVEGGPAPPAYSEA